MQEGNRLFLGVSKVSGTVLGACFVPARFTLATTLGGGHHRLCVTNEETGSRSTEVTQSKVPQAFGWAEGRCELEPPGPVSSSSVFVEGEEMTRPPSLRPAAEGSHSFPPLCADRPSTD